MYRMIDDEQKIRGEKENDEDQRWHFAARISTVDQTGDGENQHRQLTKDVEETNDQHHSGDFRFRFQTLSDRFGMQNEVLGRFRADLSVDDANQNDPKNQTDQPGNQQRDDRRDHFENNQGRRIRSVDIVGRNGQQSEEENAQQRSTFVATWTINLRIKRFDDDRQPKDGDRHH